MVVRTSPIRKKIGDRHGTGHAKDPRAHHSPQYRVPHSGADSDSRQSVRRKRSGGSDGHYQDSPHIPERVAFQERAVPRHADNP